MSESVVPRSLLTVEGLEVTYGRGLRRTHALRGASFALQPGQSLGVIGETGSGKSTLARAVLGLVRPAAGTIRLAGEDLTRFNGGQWRDLRRRGVAQYVFQDSLRSLDPDLPVGTSIAEPLLIGGSDRRTVAAKVEALAHQVNLDPDLLRRLPGELSGGQRQRVVVARALITSPQLLILDEPVSALDAANRVQVLELLVRLRASESTSLIFISHDLGSVAGIADQVVVLYRGQIVEAGPTEQIVLRPRHPYTRLLIGSAPTLASGAVDRVRRDELRAELQALEPVGAGS
ncbi:ABC transporter ATP-binding protein [uncultured Friedmanniella sp.]|uniref:ABC transporter ATP-binding protein n=1 Tax=uncultured Friedmanniella sp. TaxID=335381 RepID=UPI0035CC1139